MRYQPETATVTQSSHSVLAGLLKGIGTKAPFNGGFTFAWLSTKLCCPRLLRPDLFMNRPAINFVILRRANLASISRPSKIHVCLEILSQSSKLLV